MPGVAVEVIVLDACTDRTGAAWRGTPASDVVDGRRTATSGRARAAGFAHALRGTAPDRSLARHHRRRLARPADWLARQLRHAAAGADVVAGTVAVEDWSPWPPPLAVTYRTGYDREAWHVHGANLAASAPAYLAAGGFPPLALAEDHAFVSAARRTGHRIAYAHDLPVVTSSRRTARAAGGFSAFLGRLAATVPSCRPAGDGGS